VSAFKTPFSEGLTVHHVEFFDFGKGGFLFAPDPSGLCGLISLLILGSFFLFWSSRDSLGAVLFFEKFWSVSCPFSSLA